MKSRTSSWTVGLTDDGRVRLSIVDLAEDGVDTLTDSLLTSEQAEALAGALYRKAAVARYRDR